MYQKYRIQIHEKSLRSYKKYNKDKEEFLNNFRKIQTIQKMQRQIIGTTKGNTINTRNTEQHPLKTQGNSINTRNAYKKQWK